MKFKNLDISPKILQGLNDGEHKELTELQETIIPAFLEDRDAFIKADDIQGKVEVIAITALDKLTKTDTTDGTQILILTPNSKGAHHIIGQISEIGTHLSVASASIDEDGDKGVQEQALKNGTPILVANPNRLLDILEDQLFIFRAVNYLIVDGLDEMVNLGHEDLLKGIKKRIFSEPQKLLFTNELNEQVKSLSDYFLNEPAFIGFEELSSNGQRLQEPPQVSEGLTQAYINVPSRMKITTLMAHIENTQPDKCVIFTASKRGTDRLYRILRKNNLKATSLHGKLSDEKHAQRFSNFSKGDIQYLLVSDISARELDLDKVTQVINYDVPNDPEEYKYRANLVGSGKAARIVSLVSKQDRSDIRDLKNELGQAPQELPLPEKVHKKLKERKKKGGRDQKKSRSSRNNKGKKPKKEQKKDNDLELPRPSYDKLSGGRKGDDDERTGVVEFFKKLFS